jgi:hypothetical protein
VTATGQRGCDAGLTPVRRGPFRHSRRRSARLAHSGAGPGATMTCTVSANVRQITTTVARPAPRNSMVPSWTITVCSGPLITSNDERGASTEVGAWVRRIGDPPPVLQPERRSCSRPARTAPESHGARHARAVPSGSCRTSCETCESCAQRRRSRSCAPQWIGSCPC